MADTDLHDVTITTATIEIKALRVSGKALTVAVYKQLPELPVVMTRLDETVDCGARWDLEPVDEVWGWVNKCPRIHCFHTVHAVVTQNGGLYLQFYTSGDFDVDHSLKLRHEQYREAALAKYRPSWGFGVKSGMEEEYTAARKELEGAQERQRAMARDRARALFLERVQLVFTRPQLFIAV